MTTAQEKTLMARIMTTLMGGPAMALTLKGISEMDWDTIGFGLGWVVVAHIWFLLLTAGSKK